MKKRIDEIFNPANFSLYLFLVKKRCLQYFITLKTYLTLSTIQKKMTMSSYPILKKKWDSNKYNKKLENIAMVLENINPKGLPNLIGLCEVENKKVVEDLIYSSELKQKKYDIVHKDSPDKRGIDCALIFDENFELIMTDFIEVVIPESKKPTRDIICQIKI